MQTAREASRAARRERRQSLVLESTRLELSISGLLVEVVVTQQYNNPLDKPLEAIFNLALPTDATFLGLRVTLDGRELCGVIQAKAAASARYEDAVADGDGAVLLENPEPGQYVVNVGNLKSGEQARVVIRYALWLHPMRDEVRLKLPTVLAPRFGTPLLPPHQQHQTALDERHAFSLHATVEGPLATAHVECPSHALTLEHGAGGIGLRIDNAEMDRDVVLLFSAETIASSALVCADGEERASMLALRLPADESAPLPADIVFLIDCSGSMGGDSITQAGAALAQIAGSLSPADRFQVVCFGSHVKPLHERWQAVDTHARARLRMFAEHLQADLGGTELVSALRHCTRAFATPEAGRERIIFIVSDGQVSSDELQEASGQCRERMIRVFAVAVGSAPVRATFEALCESSGGAIEEAIPGEGMASKIVRHFRRIGGGQWTLAAMDWSSATTWTTAAGVGYAGDTVHLAAGCSTLPDGPLRATLRSAGGATQEITMQPIVVHGDTLLRMAGRQRWAEASDPQRRTELALHYQLLTPETGCVVVAERAAAARTDGMPVLRQLPQQLPAGWGGVGKANALLSTSSQGLPRGGTSEYFDFSLVAVAETRSRHEVVVRAHIPGADDGICEFSCPASFAEAGSGTTTRDRNPGPHAVADHDDINGDPGQPSARAYLAWLLTCLDRDPALRARIRTGLAPVTELIKGVPYATWLDMVDAVDPGSNVDDSALLRTFWQQLAVRWLAPLEAAGHAVGIEAREIVTTQPCHDPALAARMANWVARLGADDWTTAGTGV